MLALTTAVATPFFWVVVERLAERALLEAVVEARLRARGLFFRAAVRGGGLLVAFLLTVTAMTCLLYYSVHEHGGIMESRQTKPYEVYHGGGVVVERG